jgi:oligoendopeptidase F
MKHAYFISNESTAPSEIRSTPSRSEVAEADTWDLSPLYATDADWEAEFQSVGETFPGVTKFQGRIAEGPGVLLELLEFEKCLNLRIEQLNQFAALRVTEDSSNSESLARESKLQALFTRIGEAFAFISPEIQELDDDSFERYLGDPLLSEWTIPLRKLRRRKPHTLTLPEERLLALGASTIGGHQETFSQLTNVDMKFGRVRTDGGEEIELTQSSFSSMLVQRNPEVRRNAFQQFYREFSDHEFTLAASLASSVRADVFYARARNHPSAREASLFWDDVPVSVYDNLIDSVHKNLSPLFRYFGLRRQVLGLDELHHYDTYVPLVSEVKTDIPWDDAVEKVLSAVRPLGSRYVETLRHGLGSARWCDRYENKGKRSGAFSYGTYQSPPYIMMNYKRDVFSDVYTLAHEAGHSMHTLFSRETQSYQNYHYPIFLAEVASTFNEILLTDHLLETTDDPAMKAFLLNREIDDFRGTLYRQTMFAEFEKLIHEIEEAGEPLTLEVFRKTYRGLLDVYFGDAVVIDTELELECLRIPHFYSAFYVYKYATGLSAAVALARQVKESGDAGRYLNFLRSGSSKYPLETLDAAGVDMRSPAPVDAALAHFAERVDQLAGLLSDSTCSAL